MREQCTAEFGAIMGFPFKAQDAAVLRPVVDGNYRRSREVYTNLRRAITDARALASDLPRGCGGAAGRALFVMRGILPVLPDLTEPPFNDLSSGSDGRSALVRFWDDQARRVLGKTLSVRDLAVITLLYGECPRETYEALLRGEPKGLTVAAVISEEVKRIGRVRDR